MEITQPNFAEAAVASAGVISEADDILKVVISETIARIDGTSEAVISTNAISGAGILVIVDLKAVISGIGVSGMAATLDTADFS